MRISDWSSDVCSSDLCLGGVIGLADPVGREGVGRHDVRPRLQIGARDRLGHLGLGQREDVVIALLILGQPQMAGIIGLRELPALDLGAERAIGDQDALGGFGIGLVPRSEERRVGKECVSTGRFWGWPYKKK